jgi:uncharacterized protein DUF6457
MSELDGWIAAAGAELGIDPGDVPVKAVLELARDVAHQVVRPGAPVAAYLLGLAIGRGTDPAEAAGRLTELARSWPARGGVAAETPGRAGDEDAVQMSARATGDVAVETPAPPVA